MTKNLFLVLITSILLLSCGNPELENKIKELEQVNSQLTTEISEKDTSISMFFQDFNQIEATLQEIDVQKEALQIELQNGIEFEPSIIERITGQIQFLNTAIEQNNLKIEKLLYDIDKRNLKISSLNTTISSLKAKLTEKNNAITKLKKRLVKMNFKIDDLNESLDSLTYVAQLQHDVLEIQQEELETAYYCYGTSKELKENKVISKTGGIIGLGKTSKLSPDFNKEYFKKINTEKTTEIILGVKKMKLITVHPSNSYEIIGSKKQVEKIVIKDTYRFWQASKFLVMEVE